MVKAVEPASFLEIKEIPVGESEVEKLILIPLDAACLKKIGPLLAVGVPKKANSQ